MDHAEVDEDESCPVCTLELDTDLAITRHNSALADPNLVRLPCQCRDGFYHRTCLEACWRQHPAVKCPLCRSCLLSIAGCMNNEGFAAAVLGALGCLVPSKQILDQATGDEHVSDICINIENLTASSNGLVAMLEAAARDGRTDLFLAPVAPREPPSTGEELFAVVDIGVRLVYQFLGIECKQINNSICFPDLIRYEFLDRKRPARTQAIGLGVSSLLNGEFFGLKQSLLQIVCASDFARKLSAHDQRLNRVVYTHLLLQAKADPLQPDSTGVSSLLVAIESGADVLHTLLFSSAFGASLFFDKPGCCNCRSAGERLQVDLTAAKYPNSHILLTAIRRNPGTVTLDTVALLVKAKAAVDGADEHGITPLMHVVQENHVDIAKVLILLGADVGKTDSNFSIHKSARLGRIELVKVLLCGVRLKFGRAHEWAHEHHDVADSIVDGRFGPYKYIMTEPVVVAREPGSSVRWDKKDYERCRAVDSEGRTALWYAASEGRVDVLRLLLEILGRDDILKMAEDPDMRRRRGGVAQRQAAERGAHWRGGVAQRQAAERGARVAQGQAAERGAHWHLKCVWLFLVKSLIGLGFG